MHNVTGCGLLEGEHAAQPNNFQHSTILILLDRARSPSARLAGATACPYDDLSKYDFLMANGCLSETARPKNIQP